jgi:cytochrome c
MLIPSRDREGAVLKSYAGRRTRISRSRERTLPGWGACALTLALCCCFCGRARKRTAVQITGGNPARGKAALVHYGCSSCHTIPGVHGADGLVGPPLTGLRHRVYISVLPNTPQNLMDWIRHPRQVDKQAAMPNTGVTASDARDIAAYLYALK